MSIGQISWLTVVILCVISAALLLIEGYLGYSGVVFAVGLSAAINLR